MPMPPSIIRIHTNLEKVKKKVRGHEKGIFPPLILDNIPPVWHTGFRGRDLACGQSADYQGVSDDDHYHVVRMGRVNLGRLLRRDDRRPPLSLDWDELVIAIQEGAAGKIVEVEDEEDGEKVEVYVE